MARKTIKQMTMEILLDAAAKNRKEISFGEGMFICENMSRYFYYWWIADEYIKFRNKTKDSRDIMRTISINLRQRFLAVTEAMSKTIDKAIFNA